MRLSSGLSFFLILFLMVLTENAKNAEAHRMGLFHDSTPEILKRQRRIWQSNEPDRYFMKFTWICSGCLEHEKGPFIVEVQNNKIVQATTASDGTPVTKFHLFTMDGWFDMLICLVEAGESFKDLEFDPIEGYPTLAITEMYGARVELLKEKVKRGRKTIGL